jgi:hypothetical protein
MQINPDQNIPNVESPSKIEAPPNEAEGNALGAVVGKVFSQLSYLGNAAYQQLRSPLSHRVSITSKESIAATHEIQLLRRDVEKDIEKIPQAKNLLERLDKLPPHTFPLFLDGIKKLKLMNEWIFLQCVEKMLDFCDVANATNFVPLSLDKFIPNDFIKEIMGIDFRSLYDPQFELTTEKRQEICLFVGNVIQITRNVNSWWKAGSEKDAVKNFIKTLLTRLKYKPLDKEGYENLVSMISKREIEIDADLLTFLSLFPQSGKFIINLKREDLYNFLKENNFKISIETAKYYFDEVERKGIVLYEHSYDASYFLRLRQELSNPFLNITEKYESIIFNENIRAFAVKNLEFLKKTKALKAFSSEQQFQIALKLVNHIDLLDLLEIFNLNFDDKCKIASKVAQVDTSFEEAVSKYLFSNPEIMKKEKVVVELIEHAFFQKRPKILLLFRKEFFEGPGAFFRHPELLNFLSKAITDCDAFPQLTESFMRGLNITREEFLSLFIAYSNQPHFNPQKAFNVPRDSESSIYGFTSTERLKFVERTLRSDLIRIYRGLSPYKVLDKDSSISQLSKPFIEELPKESKKIDPQIFEVLTSKSREEIDPSIVQKTEEIMDSLRLYCFTPDLPLPEIPAAARKIIMEKRPLLGLFLFSQTYVDHPEYLASVTSACPEIAFLLKLDKPHAISFKWIGALALRLQFEDLLSSLSTHTNMFEVALRVRGLTERYLLTDFIITEGVVKKQLKLPFIKGFETEQGAAFDLLLSSFFIVDGSHLQPLRKIKSSQDWQVIYSGLKALAKNQYLNKAAKTAILNSLIGREKLNFDLFIEEMALLPTLMEISAQDVYAVLQDGPGSLKKYLVNILQNIMGVDIKDYPQFKDLNDLFYKVFEDPSVRSPNAIFVFALKINSLQDEHLNRSMREFVASIIKGGTAFKDIRYGEDNKHLNSLFKDKKLKENWIKGEVLPLTELTRSTTTTLNGFTVEDTDDWQDLLLCGLEIIGSCQSVYGDPNKMKCLLGYILGGETRLILVRHPSKVMVGRRLMRLLSAEGTGKEVLYKEELYKDLRLSTLMESAIDQMFIRRAKSLQRDLVKERKNQEEPTYTESLQSTGTRAPFTYVDAPSEPRQVVEKGVYKISPNKLTLLYSAGLPQKDPLEIKSKD